MDLNATTAERLFACSRRFQHCNNYNKGCHCDDICNQYHDCCYDSRYINRTVVQHDKYVALSVCNDFKYNWRALDGLRQAAFMVSKCLPTWPENGIKSKCEMKPLTNVLDIVPVFDNQTSLTFRNSHCALCNGFSDLLPWKLELTFNEYFISDDAIPFTEVIMNAILSNELHAYEFLPPYPDRIRRCLPGIQYSAGDGETSTVCTNGEMSPVVIDMKLPTSELYMYARNTECAKLLLKEMNTSSVKSVFCFLGRRMMVSERSLSVLFDFSGILAHQEQSMVECEEMDIRLSDQVRILM